MFESKILDTSENNQKLWRKLVEAMTIKDIYFIPEYTVLFEKTQGDIKKSFGGKAQLFFYGDNENYIIYPFFKRKIKELPFGKLISGEGDNLFDITSPYGFSGPIANIKKKEI